MSTERAAARSRAFAGRPITDSDETIAEALDDVSIPTLLLSMIHMSGDESILDGPLRPEGIYLNEVQGFMTEEAKAEVRRRALDVIRDYRDRGSELPPPPSAETVRRMMSFVACEEIPDEYVPMMLEELELDGLDSRDFGWGDRIPADAKERFHVVVIGAGMSGILAAIRLSEAGIPFTVVEKNAGAGGTWFENRYPGCRVDVGNHYYSYSFEPNNQWSEFFCQSDELREYFERCTREYEIDDRIRYETEVEAANWDEASQRWSVHVRTATGDIEQIEADAVISAVGQLNRPKIPDFEGVDRFEGATMHSAQWRSDVDITGRRVAVIGTGASAFQIVPTIAPDVGHLDVYQRSAPWMFPNPNYHEQVGDGVRWALEHLPYYGRWYRFLILWPACDGGMPVMRIDPDYPHQDRAISELNDAAREMFTQWMAEQVGDDEDLLAKVVPDYVCLGKRTLQDNGSWLGALTRDDVDLITDPIDHFDETGIVTVDGEHHPVDVVVFATGFHANRFLWPMDIRGREGVTLAEQWGDEPQAYLGITVPRFPNLFCLYGPGTNLASGGSLIFHSECEMRYIMGCLTELMGSEHRSIEVRQDVHDDYNRRLQAELDMMAWTHPTVTTSWYQNDDGRIYILSPWRLVDFWTWTRQPDFDEFVLR